MWIFLLSIDVVFFIFIFLYIKWRFSAQQPNSGFPDSLRKELESMIIEMNETAERNITLIEAKISALSRLMEEADKKIDILRKEETSRSESRMVYERMAMAGKIENIKRKKEISGKAAEIKSKKERVMEMAAGGKGAASIAETLGLPIGEVEFIISFENGKI